MSKTVKKIKCKKCHLEYNKKEYECPYCHKKRFKPTGLIIAIILILAACGAAFYFKGDEILKAVNGTKTVTSFEHNHVAYEIKNVTFSKLLGIPMVKFEIEAENKNKSETTLNCKLSAYQDSYLINSWGNSSFNETLQPNTKVKGTYELIISEDWNEITIYGSFGTEDGSMEMFKIYNTDTNS